MHSNNSQEMSAAELRKFGLSTGTIFAVVFGVVIPWIWDFRYPTWPWFIFAVLVPWALIAPVSLGPVYRLWMRFGLLISKITTPLILGILFFLVILPVGLAMRIFKGDPLKRQLDANAGTYRVDSLKQPVDTLEKPY